MKRDEVEKTLLKFKGDGTGMKVAMTAEIAQNSCSTLREVLAQLHTEEFNAFSHATDDFTAAKHAANMKAIYSVMKLIRERQPVA